MRPDQRLFFPGWASGTLVVLAAAAVAFLIWSLAEQNRELKQALADHRGSPERTRGLAGGDFLPPLAVVSLDGSRPDLLEVAQGAVVAFFTTTCPYCEDTLPQWSRIHRALSDLGIRFAGISLHERARTGEFVVSNGIGWPVWILEDPDGRAGLRVRSVPLTVVVSDGGEVVRAWRGALGDDQVPGIIAVAGQVLSPERGTGRFHAVPRGPLSCDRPFGQSEWSERQRTERKEGSR